ncbi:ABC transporter substrate-binding protein [Roseobacter sp. YSTF-M11]|uniref:ABC transporter substrate-binding protein n=1 Tax=Roseobacter insulae TaxID=2859783 RepID=A0A9X1K0J9_9RHOB|nr:ABC transporter substrate-binding protein [Roseobacter insulae]MBW4708239.1 ABC transporter substrate-binding protein [Roseobacter insulae]
MHKPLHILAWTMLCCSFGQSAVAERLRLYIDADYSIARPAADAIELGVRSALSEVDYAIGDIELEVVPMDHRANSKRSMANLRAFENDPQALAVIGGVHSPPYLTNREHINDRGLLLLLPWSAAGPITRPEAGQVNWIFRLSVDDTKAGPFLVNHVLNNRRCQRTALLLVDTGWGRANRVTMLEAFREAKANEPVVFTFPTALGSASARTLAENVAGMDVDCAIMLSNAQEGALLVNELHELAPHIRLVSHWGIVSGDFRDMVSHTVRSDLQIEVLQTCGLKVERDGSTVLAQALRSASTQAHPFERLSDVHASTGFVHSYDLVKILLAAIAQTSGSDAWKHGSISERRNLLRVALEDLARPVEGILKTYNRPFGPFSDSAPDAHEALNGQDLCVASFAESGRLVLSEMADHDS